MGDLEPLDPSQREPAARSRPRRADEPVGVGHDARPRGSPPPPLLARGIRWGVAVGAVFWALLFGGIWLVW